MHHETPPASARLRVPVRRVSSGANSGPNTPTFPGPLAGRGDQGVPHGTLLAGVAARQRRVHSEPGKLPEAGQEAAGHPGAGHRRAVRVHDVRRDRGHRRVPDPHAVAVRHACH